MSDHNLIVLGTVFGGLEAVGTYVIVFLMLKERERPEYDRRYWPFYIGLGIAVLATLPPGYLAYRLWSGPTEQLPRSGQQGTISNQVASLPTSPSGLPAGTIWNDGGVLAVVPQPSPPLQNSTAPLPKSPFLGLDDAKRWQIFAALQRDLRNNGAKHCDVRMWIKPGSASASDFWQEISPILTNLNWDMAGSDTSRTAFPDGITLSVGVDNGEPFNCAFRLEQFLDSQGIGPPSIRVSQVSPDLIKCQNRCMEMVIGDVAVQHH